MAPSANWCSISADCALFSVEELKHLHHAGRARQSQSHVCHRRLVRDPECTRPTARLYPSSGCATTGGDVLISSGFRAFVIPCKCQCSDGTGREPVGEVDPIGLVWIPVRKRKLFLRLFEVKALRRTEISSLWQSYGKCFHFYIHLLHIPAFTLQASLDSPV